jgi:Zn-finger nucleic acid-binding protein
MRKHGLYGIVVDRCEGHGVWLDGDGELARIVANAVARI